MIPSTDSQTQSRREFLRRGAQGGAVAALAGVVALAVRGRGVLLPGDCQGSGPCGGCALLARCGLPGATAARGATSRS